MNILITTSTLPRWPGDTVQPIVYEYAKHLRALHPESTIVLLAPHYPGAPKYEITDNIIISRFTYFITPWQTLAYGNGILTNLKQAPWRIIQLPFFLISQLIAIHRLAGKHTINILHANWLLPQGLLIVLYAIVFNKQIPTICTVHGSDIHSLTSSLLRKIIAFTTKKLSSIIAVSTNLATQLPAQKTKIIPGGIDTTVFKPLAPDEALQNKYNITAQCILFVGRLTAEKGVVEVIEALHIMTPQFPKAKLLIIGDGAEQKNLQALAQKLNLEQQCLFLGNMDHKELPKYYALADVVVGPSWKEGLGMVFVEALACGTPVVATTVGGIGDVIIPNKTGLVVKPQQPKELAIALKKILTDSSLRTHLIQNGLQHIEHFRWPYIIEKHMQLYSSHTPS